MDASRNISANKVSLKKKVPFSVRSYRNLKDQLGEMDELAAAITISLRHTERHIRNLRDPTEFLRSAASEIGRKSPLNHNFSTSRASSAHLLLVGAYQHSELFFSEYALEQKAMGKSWGSKRPGESPLQYVLREMKFRGSDDQKPKPEWQEIVEFYRRMRNAFVHKYIPHEQIEKAFKDVVGLRGYVKREFKLEAPNEFHNMNFSDYLLFTRAVKNIANSLAAMAVPERAVDLIYYLNSLHRGKAGPLRDFVGKRDNVLNLRIAMRNWFKICHQFDLTQHPVWEDELVAYIATLPNKIVRRKELPKVTFEEAAKKLVP